MENKSQKILTTLQSLKIFSEFSITELKEFLPVTKFISLAAKEHLPLGRWRRYFFIVVEGDLHEVEKTRFKRKFAQKDLRSGETIDAKKLLTKSHKIIPHRQIEAKDPSLLLAIPIDWFNQQAEKNVNFNNALLTVAGEVAHQLRQVNLAYTSLFKRFLNLSDHVIYILGILSVFIFFVPWVKKMYAHTHYPLTLATVLISVVALSTLVGTKSSGLRWRDLGIQSKNLSKYILEAIGFTLIVIAVILLFEQVMLRYFTIFKIHEFIGLRTFSHLSTARLVYGSILYVFFCFAQELIARGCLQGPLSMLLSAPQAKLKSIVIANIIYSALRVPYSLQLALVSLIVGLFWGWLYARQHNIFSVTISHVMVGFVVVML